MKQSNKKKIIDYLEELFEESKCELNFSTPFQLLVAVILSAQCTDKRVNMITPILFQKFSTPKDFATAKVEDIEEIIKPCGFFKNKAKNIKNASIQIIEYFNGELPTNVKDMMTLDGVGMKTAKVVCGQIYNADVIAVDTHVLRVTNRLGIVDEKDPNKCSVKLENEFKNNIKGIHHRLVLFGRYFCKARNPQCDDCKLKDICKYYKNACNKK